MTAPRETIRLAAVADLHCARTPSGGLASLFTEAASQADVLLLGGDLTDYGLPEEAHLLARELSGVKIPVLGVLGNHDCESGHEAEVVKILVEAGVQMLDGDSVEVDGVGFAGVKGFGGGFGRRTLEPWGEAATKSFVHEAVGEALKLERALARLRTPQRVALLHYAPIEATVEGEPRELFPFLGSSRLEEPLNRYEVTVAFHGHAHRGAPEGRTSAGIPVFNVAMPLLRRVLSDAMPIRIVEIPALAPVSATAEPPSRRRDDLH
ncbi:MAG TPA: metallophosphoesterase [Vicinamibacteria bacterium]|nr:metallophosphoesterase [Vicinamibacteria bacterium]